MKISDVARLDALGVDKKDVARRIVRLYCQMIFVDGVYHADPHPGNVLVQAGRRDRPARLRRGGRAQSADARGHPRVPRGRAPARHRPARQGDAQDGLHLAHHRRGREREDHRVLPPALPGGGAARELQPEGHQDRSAARPREPARSAPDEHRPAGALGRVPRPQGLRAARAHDPPALRVLLAARSRAQPGGDHPAVPAGLRPRQPRLGRRSRSRRSATWR